ncbi:MAG TPA: RHS repeat-associated core domain-containing protein [Candidatus Acidoferrales bacterium]|nr:RHS repeat-associated core domain-containing protein [Candidatus Acidoferrales bacterium]
MRKRVLFAVLFAFALLCIFFWWHRFHSRGSAPLALEQCDPAGYVPCIQQAAFVSIPVVNTSLYLTYSSQWANSRDGQRSWDARWIGLGGWSFNLVQRYDSKNRVILGGDGSWRIANSVTLPSSGSAVPSFEGSVAYVFDSAGRHLRTVDGHLGTTLVTIAYDSGGRLSRLDGFFGGQPVHVSVRRSPDGTPTQLIGTDGATTGLEVDATGRLIAVTDPAGNTTHVAWGSEGLVASETDPLGAVTRFAYDDSGRLASATDADGVVERFDRMASAGKVKIEISTALGRRLAYRAESVSGGIRRTLTTADGAASTETTDSHGSITLNAAGDASWTIGTVPSPVWGMVAPLLTPVLETRSDGVISRRELKNDLHPQRGLPYVRSGSVVTTINGHAWTQTFDPDQRSVTLIDPAGRRTISVYDQQGRLIRHLQPGAAPVSYTYNAEGRETAVTIGAGPLARTTRFAYDSGSGEIAITRPDGVVEKSRTDRAGRAVSASAGDGSTLAATYDSAGRLIRLQPPGGLTFTLGCSSAGRPTGFAPPVVKGDASVETTSFNADGQAAAIAGMGRRAVNISYDDAGRVSALAFDQGKRTASYDAHSGLLAQAGDPSGVITKYGYAGRSPASLAWSGPISGSVGTKLDANGRVVSESVDGGNGLDFAYDAAGNLTGAGPLSINRDAATGLVTNTSLGIVQTRQEFDASGELIRSTASASGKLLLDQRYTRDNLGRIKSVLETTSEEKASTTEFFYDPAGRLSAVRVNGHLVEADAYDPAGNRASVTRANGKIAAAYDERGRLTNWGSVHYIWAPDGHLARREDPSGAASFTYDDFGGLRKASLPGRREITYLLDAEGRRVGRKIDGKLAAEYLYRPDGSIAAETDGAGKIVSRFAYDGDGHLGLIMRVAATYRVITDTIGSPRLIIDSKAGAIADAIDYDAWGRITRETSPNFIPIGFAGGLRDPDTGLIRFGARDYDPAVGRWTASDPIRFNGGDANLYRYAAGDPVNFVDSSGLASDDSSGQLAPAAPPPPMITLVSSWSRRPPSQSPQGGNSGPAQVITLTAPINRPPQMITLTAPINRTPGQGNNSQPGGNSGSNGGTPNQNPPPGGNPSPGGNPTPWSCWGGICPTPDPGPGGCLFGNCNNGPNGFNCWGIYCEKPNGDNCWFCSMGEPHLTGAGGAHFDFQAAGEFLIAASPDGNLVIQARQEPWGKQVSLNTAVVANVHGDRVGVYAREPSFLMANGAAINDSDFVERRLPHGGALERHGGTVVVGWPDGSRLTMTRFADALNYGFVPGSQTGSLRGLLASSTTNPQKTLTTRSGALLNISDSDFRTKLYREFANSWRITQPESLFHYWSGESTAKFTDLNMPYKPVSACSFSSDQRSKAEATCRAFGVNLQPDLDDCILDVALTGMPAFAAASVGMRPLPVPKSSSAPSSVSFSASVSPSTAADEFAIKVGDTVSPDHPSPGAGHVTRAGEKQAYSFSISGSTELYVTVGPCQGAPPRFDVLQADNTYLGGQIGCRDFGPIALSKGGVYRIVAKADGPSARYSFILHAALFDRYSIRIGDTVSPDHPVPGAGIIKELGQKQFYSFSGKAGDAVFLTLGPCQGANPSFSILKPDNTLLDGDIGNCHVNFREVLPVTGSYQILAITDKSNLLSHYGFSLSPVPADQHFPVRLPLIVSPGVPARGAGRVAAAGAQQFYDFTAKPGAAVHIATKCGGACQNLLIRATRAGDSSTYGFWDLNFANGDWKLPDGGKYTIQVRSMGYVGEYGFVATEAPQHH